MTGRYVSLRAGSGQPSTLILELKRHGFVESKAIGYIVGVGVIANTCYTLLYLYYEISQNHIRMIQAPVLGQEAGLFTPARFLIDPSGSWALLARGTWNIIP